MTSKLLSCCMIVRDSELTLPAALAGIRNYVDDLVVVDTGSLDRTREIALAHGARLFEFPWCDDFSAARNESIRHARGKWIFWMDSDDTIDEANASALHKLAHGSHAPNTLGYVMRVVCPGRAEYGADEATEVDHI